MALKIRRNIRNLRNTRNKWTRNYEKTLRRKTSCCASRGDTYHPIREGLRTSTPSGVLKDKYHLQPNNDFTGVPRGFGHGELFLFQRSEPVLWHYFGTIICFSSQFLVFRHGSIDFFEICCKIETYQLKRNPYRKLESMKGIF